MHVVLVGWYVPGITENMLHKSRQFKKKPGTGVLYIATFTVRALRYVVHC